MLLDKALAPTTDRFAGEHDCASCHERGTLHRAMRLLIRGLDRFLRRRQSVFELRADPAALLLFALGLAACSGAPWRKVDYLTGYPALADDRWVHVVVEIPAGTNEKWEVDKTSGALHWEREDGKRRVVRYLAYPGNYGMIPRTSLPHDLGGDGDPLDVLLLGPRVERGAVVRARPIAVLRLVDDGERDDKILAVRTSGPLSDVVDLETLDSRYPGVRLIIETWFTSYKGRGRVVAAGFGDAAAAMAVVREASRYYEANAERTE